jgi:hypothetical protein
MSEPEIGPDGWPTREAEHEMMTHPDEWPAWPVLPLKKRGKPGETGFLTEDVMGEPIKPSVRIGNIYAAESGPVVQYGSFEALLDAGWVVD